jgi:hypothetical protein
MRKLTRVLTFALLAPFVFASVLAAQTGPEPPKFAIVISAEKPEVPLGSDIVIAIAITNISEEGISIGCGYHGNVQDGYQYDIRDGLGVVVPQIGKRYAHFSDGGTMEIPRPPGDPRPGGCGIKPRGFIKVYSTISDDYNFDHPGKYTIRVWKPATMGAPEKPESNRVYSNTITITVVEPPTPAAAPQ